MEASFTEKPCKKKVPPRSTEKASLGRQFEEFTAHYLKRKGWSVLASNLRFKVGEVDLFAYDPERKRHVVVEVRGRRSNHYLPSRMLSPHKVRRLKTMAKILQERKATPIHILFVEVVRKNEKLEIREFPIENY